MAERTKRGEEDRKKEDGEMTGEPVETATPGKAGMRVADTTRDKSVEPAKDIQRGGDKKS